MGGAQIGPQCLEATPLGDLSHCRPHPSLSFTPGPLPSFLFAGPCRYLSLRPLLSTDLSPSCQLSVFRPLSAFPSPLKDSSMIKCPLSYPPLTPKWLCSYVHFALQCLDVGLQIISVFFPLKKFEHKFKFGIELWGLVV